MNDLSCGIRIWAQVSFVLSQSTRLTNGQTDRKALAITCVALHAVALRNQTDISGSKMFVYFSVDFLPADC